MLVHQCKRINSPLLVITTHPGQNFPTLLSKPFSATTATTASTNNNMLKDNYFDRVLCDVPCSGDGTMRKNPMIWNRWSTLSGMYVYVYTYSFVCVCYMLTHFSITLNIPSTTFSSYCYCQVYHCIPFRFKSPPAVYSCWPRTVS